MFLLAASILALGLGPGLVALGRRVPAMLSAIEVGVPLVLLLFVSVDLLPHALEDAGAWALLALALGVVVPSLLERLVGDHGPGAPGHDHHAHAGSHSHTPPGNTPGHSGRAGRLAVFVALAGLALHALLDGVAIAADVASEAVSTLGLGVVLHRVSDGASVVWLGQGRLSRAETLGMLAVIALATVLGYFTALYALPVLSEALMAWLLAFLSGVLLHVTVAHTAVFQRSLQWVTRRHRDATR